MVYQFDTTRDAGVLAAGPRFLDYFLYYISTKTLIFPVIKIWKVYSQNVWDSSYSFYLFIYLKYHVKDKASYTGK